MLRVFRHLRIAAKIAAGLALLGLAIAATWYAYQFWYWRGGLWPGG